MMTLKTMPFDHDDGQNMKTLKIMAFDHEDHLHQSYRDLPLSSLANGSVTSIHSTFQSVSPVKKIGPVNPFLHEYSC